MQLPWSRRHANQIMLQGNVQVQISRPNTVWLAPGQSRAVTISVTSGSSAPSRKIIFRLRYRICKFPGEQTTPWCTCGVTTRKMSEPHRMTFLHPSGTVSYAILRAPTQCDTKQIQDVELPVLLNLHGAGLDADDSQVRNMLDSVKDINAWVICPTGGTTWSGDDWRKSTTARMLQDLEWTDVWGFDDVKAAIAAIPSWIENMSWRGPSARLDALYIVGHSNGGQGVWYALTHIPDSIKGAAPVSGYSSIQAYVPYTFWHEADPRIASIIQCSLSTYRHELLLDNTKGIPILQQHGGKDHNVPVFHSRRMHQLLSQSGSSAKYHELPGEDHWFDGIMVTSPLRRFYDKISNCDADEPRLPQKFSIVVPCNSLLGPRGGILVEQLASPDQHGLLQVCRGDTGSWTLESSNVRRFRLSLSTLLEDGTESITIDDCRVQLDTSIASDFFWFERRSCGAWTVSHFRYPFFMESYLIC